MCDERDIRPEDKTMAAQTHHLTTLSVVFEINWQEIIKKGLKDKYPRDSYEWRAGDYQDAIVDGVVKLLDCSK